MGGLIQTAIILGYSRQSTRESSLSPLTIIFTLEFERILKIPI